MQQTLIPATRVTSPWFNYKRAVTTDVQATWRRHGWTPPDRWRHEQMRLLLNRLS